MRKMPKCKVVSVQYVNHPAAAQKWFDLFAELIFKEVQNREASAIDLEVLDD